MRPRFLLTALLVASPVAAAERDAGFAPVVCVVADDPEGLGLLVAALVARGIEAEACTPDAAEPWTVEAHGLSSTAPIVRVHSPDGTVWKPNVDAGEGADTEERVRATAVAVSTVLDLLRQGIEPPVPSEPPPVVETPPPVEPPTPVEPPPPAPTPEPEAEPGPEGSAALILAAVGNLGPRDSWLGTAGAVGLRLDLSFPSGVWLALDFDWTATGLRRSETLLLETGTPRLFAGAVLGPGVWTVRLGLGWAVQGWWTAGGAAPQGWRMGGTLVLAPAWQPLAWLRLGIDFALDLYRTRVEIRYGDEPLFALDHWRWRAGLWAAVPFGGN